MDIGTWLAFAGASILLLMIPGPTVLLVCAYALGAGRRTALWSVSGVVAGDFVAMTASVLGLGALVLASGDLFLILRWIGAAYLVWLGIKLWRAPAEIGEAGQSAKAASGPAMAVHAFAVTATNPKSIVFFIAFVPQFLNPATPVAPQMAVMIATFVGLAAVNTLLYALAAGTLRDRMAKPGVLRLLNRLGASALIAMGIATAIWRRA